MVFKFKEEHPFKYWHQEKIPIPLFRLQKFFSHMNHKIITHV